MNKLIGYARIRSYSQVAQASSRLQEQREKLATVGCTRVFEEVASGQDSLTERAALSEALKCLSRGDTLVVVDTARLSRSMLHTGTLLRMLEEEGISLWALDGLHIIAS